jgi:predicted MFS family arabinose efflux permease
VRPRQSSVGVPAFTPSALSLVADAAAPGKTGHAYAWDSTAHDGALGIGPFVGALAVEWGGDGAAFVGSATGIAVALVLGLAMPVPGAALVDRTDHSSRRAAAGILGASLVTAMLPRIGSHVMLLAVVALFGAVSGMAFVAISVGLVASTTPATRGVVMGGYSTSLDLGLALGSFAFGPLIARHGHAAGFALGGAAGLIGTLVAAVQSEFPRPPRGVPGPEPRPARRGACR